MYTKCGSIEDGAGKALLGGHCMVDIAWADIAWRKALLGGHCLVPAESMGTWSWESMQQSVLTMRMEINILLLKLFVEMHKEGCKLNQFTFPSFLKACANIAATEQGKHVHYHAIRSGFEVDIYVGNSLVDMYAKCASVDDARQVFDGMPEKNVLSCNAIFVGYTQNEKSEEASTNLLLH
jgi:pentatricopeptide repeat protein